VSWNAAMEYTHLSCWTRWIEASDGEGLLGLDVALKGLHDIRMWRGAIEVGIDRVRFAGGLFLRMGTKTMSRRLLSPNLDTGSHSGSSDKVCLGLSLA
jgi:hypothetical protein